jgi:hypothetical protein
MQKYVESIVDGTKIAYDYYHQSHQYTLILLHGWCCNRTFWKHQKPVFSKKYNIISIDMVGHGDSQYKNRNDWSMYALASDVASVLQAEKLKEVILVGHSMADNIMLHLSKFDSFEIQGIVGIDNFYQVAEPVSEEKKQEVIAYFNQDYLGGLKETVGGWFVDPEKEADMVNEVFDQMKIVPEEVSRSVGIFTLEALPYEFTRSLDFPIRIIACTKWEEERAEKLYSMFKDVKITDMVPKSGHFPMMDRTKEFNVFLETAIQDILNVVAHT